MIYFIEYSDWDLVLEYFCIISKTSIEEILKNNQKLDIEKIYPTSWQTVASDLQESENLFDQVNQTIKIVDIEILGLKKTDTKYLSNLPKTRDVFFVYGASQGLTADEKKIWKSLGFEYLTLKIYNQNTKTNLLENYIASNQFGLSQAQRNILLTKTSSYTELLNVLELIFLSQKPEEVISIYFVEENLPIFMQPFGINNLKKSTKIWNQRIKEDEIQLGLSLIYGKLEKQTDPKAKMIQKQLIQTDQDMKTVLYPSGHTLWKLFLWKASQV